MAKLTIAFGVVLIVLGVWGFAGTGSAHPTALIPTWIGLALAVAGGLALTEDAKRRMIWMHVAVTVGLLGFLGAGGRAVYGYIHASSLGVAPDAIALGSQVTMAGLMLIYVILCVRSFIAARRSGKV